MSNKHFNRLVKMYENAPINKIFNPNIKISLGKSEISILVKSDFFHSANSLHGSIFFKMLDDAAYFAAHSYIDDYFLVTASFSINFIQPVTNGIIKSIGQVDSRYENKIKAESFLYDQKNVKVAFGKGVFVRSKFPLRKIDAFNGE